MIKESWNELDNYIQLPPSAPAKILTLITKEREKEKVFKFLMGLNDGIYATVRSNIIQQELVLKGKAILASICKEE